MRTVNKGDINLDRPVTRPYRLHLPENQITMEQQLQLLREQLAVVLRQVQSQKQMAVDVNVLSGAPQQQLASQPKRTKVKPLTLNGNNEIHLPFHLFDTDIEANHWKDATVV